MCRPKVENRFRGGEGKKSEHFLLGSRRLCALGKRSSRRGERTEPKNINFTPPSSLFWVLSSSACRLSVLPPSPAAAAAAIIICRPHLLPLHPLSELRTLPFPERPPVSYPSERLCAHHQFKWFSLSTAFLKYLPGARSDESVGPGEGEG